MIYIYIYIYVYEFIELTICNLSKFEAKTYNYLVNIQWINTISNYSVVRPNKMTEL